MTPEKRQNTWALALFAFIALLLLARLSSFGIWDPWELNVADAARALMAGEQIELRRAPMATQLIAVAFGAFGIEEWAGRLPLVLGGLLTLVAAFFLARRYAGARTATFTILIVGTAPVFLLNSREMLGDALGFAGAALVALCATALMLPTAAPEAEQKKRRPLWLVGLLVSIAFAIYAGGALIFALPPLLAVACVGLLTPTLRKAPGTRVVLALALLMVFQVVGAVSEDAAEYSHWLGGAPIGADPPSFDIGLEVVFHGMALWSGVMLLALGRLLSPIIPKDDDDEPRVAREFSFRLVLLLWAAFSYGAMVVYTSRYGVATFAGAVPLSIAVALFLREIEESDRSWWAEAAVMALMVGLVIRDFALFPGTAVDSIAARELTVPEVFNPRSHWAAVLGLFVVCMGLGMVADPKGETKPDFRAPWRWVRARWSDGPVTKFWIGLGALLVVGLTAFGLVCLVAGDSLPLTSIAVRAGRVMLAAPIGVVVGVAGVQVALALFARLGKHRLVPALAAACIFAVYTSQAFLPSLSEHFSPRQVYDTYNELHQEGERLGEYRVSGRAAAYYAEGDIEDIEDQSGLLEFLQSDTRQWAVIAADELPAVNRAYRSATGQHLYVADSRSARVVLVANQAVDGHPDENFLAGAILDEVPAIEHRVGTVFDERIELLGYDLETVQEGYAGAGQEFTVVWYWRALNRVPGSYKIFLHIDGQGNRLNGDHEPVEDRYPVRLWDEGDIIVDRQTLRVPANYRPGSYAMRIGFYSGGTRMPISSGPDDGDNRARAGNLIVR